MKSQIKKFRFSPVIILISGLLTSCSLSENLDSANQKQSIDVEAANKQIEEAKAAEAARIAAEKLLQAETQVQGLVGEALQFKSAVAKVYLDREFAPIWTDKAAEKQFLHEYAAMVASGVSRRSAAALETLSATPATNGNESNLAYDILLTDAFLDYMNYAKKLPLSAQKWLYSSNTYKATQPSDEDMASWTTAVQNNQNLDFIKNLSSSNHIYRQTLDKLTSSLASKNAGVELYKLAVNAQRLRVIPSFNNGIFVNIPSYQLEYYRDGKLVLNSKVIVGRDERRTPVMYSKLSNVVVNPPWYVPNTILTKDIVPKLARDPGYAERASIEIFDRKGTKINARNVNWSQYVNSKSVPFSMRQKAGDDSALGRYKFNMPSSDAIFLHDTPNRGLFGKNDRALSSGCVRVAKADELATILLKEAGWTDNRKQSVLASKKTTSASIQSSNPVYLYYVTTWVNNGKVNHLPDIYGYDKAGKPSYVNWNTIRKYL